jgi:hypothetical protein
LLFRPQARQTENQKAVLWDFEMVRLKDDWKGLRLLMVPLTAGETMSHLELQSDRLTELLSGSKMECEMAKT